MASEESQDPAQATPGVVGPGAFLTLHYRLTGPHGDVLISTFEGQPATLSLGQGQLPPALEARLVGLREHERVTMNLAEGEAFGPRNPDLLQRVSLSLMRTLSEEGAQETADAGSVSYRVGDVVRFPTPDGQPGWVGVVRGQDQEALWVDFNHPLAGQAVVFDVELIGVL